MRYMLCILVSLLFVPVSAAESDLLATTQDALVLEKQINHGREELARLTEEELRQIRNQLLAHREALQQRVDNLSGRFNSNENTLAEKENKLQLESASLGELFAVVRKAARELWQEHGNSILFIGEEPLRQEVRSIAEARTLPSRWQLNQLWLAFSRQIEASAASTEVEVEYIDSMGISTPQSVLRIGAFGLVDDKGYLNWSPELSQARSYAAQPDSPPLRQADGPSSGSTTLVSLDPSRGELLEQMAQEPTLRQRIDQGGVVGRIILGLLALGILIGVGQGGFLLANRLRINHQLKTPDDIGNNALGRVLGVYKYDESPSVEALEMRLYEAVLDEQQKLERGLSMIKLIAALSPMLGLLGTVTGMIETFQVITQFGNSDPHIMAAGISTALVTTVLGLIAAMPLLFIHNVLSSQAEGIRSILELQGIGLVALRAEQDMRGRA